MLLSKPDCGTVVFAFNRFSQQAQQHHHGRVRFPRRKGPRTGGVPDASKWFTSVVNGSRVLASIYFFCISAMQHCVR